MRKIHQASGIFITVFVAMHLFNHLFSLFGATEHIEMMNNLRVVYRNRLSETILLLSIGFQIFSGIKLFLIKRKASSTFLEQLQIWSGLYLALFFLIHIGAVLTGRIILKLDTNFYFGVAGLNTFPLNIFFVPYYSLAIISFFGHIAAVHAKKMKKNIFGFNPKKQSNILLIIGVVLAIIIIYGLTNGFKGIEIPEQYKMTT